MSGSKGEQISEEALIESALPWNPSEEHLLRFLVWVFLPFMDSLLSLIDVSSDTWKVTDKGDAFCVLIN